MNDKNKPSSFSLDLGLGALLGEGEPRPAVVPEQPKPVEVPQNEAISPLRQLMNAGEWSELLIASERRLAESSNQDSEAGVLWVRANFETQAMPLSVLAAPLDSITKSIESAQDKDTSLRILAAQTLLLVGAALHQGQDKELALVFLERAKSFDPIHSAQFTRAVEGEISRLAGMDDLSTKEKAQVEAKISNLRSHIDQSAKSKTQSGSSAPREGTSALGLLGLSAATVIGAVLVVGAYFGVSRLFSSSNDGEVSAALAMPELKTELRAPAMSKASGVNAFAGLFYDLQNADVSKPVVVPVKAVEAGPLAPADSAPAKQPLIEVINTSEPKESAEMKDALRNPQTQRSREKETAEILFGKNTRDPQPKPRDSGYDEERFLKPRTYRVIARTHIVAQPGFRTEVVGELVPGDRITAEARVESWLRIRSRTGRIGYVLQQDLQW